MASYPFYMFSGPTTASAGIDDSSNLLTLWLKHSDRSRCSCFHQLGRTETHFAGVILRNANHSKCVRANDMVVATFSDAARKMLAATYVSSHATCFSLDEQFGQSALHSCKNRGFLRRRKSLATIHGIGLQICGTLV